MGRSSTYSTNESTRVAWAACKAGIAVTGTGTQKQWEDAKQLFDQIAPNARSIDSFRSHFKQHIAVKFNVHQGKDCFVNQNTFMMRASDLDACKRACVLYNCGAFVVWRGIAFFRSQDAEACVTSLVDACNSTTYIVDAGAENNEKTPRFARVSNASTDTSSGQLSLNASDIDTVDIGSDIEVVDFDSEDDTNRFDAQGDEVTARTLVHLSQDYPLSKRERMIRVHKFDQLERGMLEQDLQHVEELSAMIQNPHIELIDVCAFTPAPRLQGIDFPLSNEEKHRQLVRIEDADRQLMAGVIHDRRNDLQQHLGEKGTAVAMHLLRQNHALRLENNSLKRRLAGEQAASKKRRQA